MNETRNQHEVWKEDTFIVFLIISHWKWRRYLAPKTSLNFQKILWRYKKRTQNWCRRIPSFGMLHRVALVITDISEERIVSIIRMTRIGELGTLAVTSNRRTMRRKKKVTASVVGKLGSCSHFTGSSHTIYPMISFSSKHASVASYC
jgi:hypothetical protein